MLVRRETIFWIAVVGTFALLVWLLRDILLPFVLGMAVGYFFDPVVERLTRWGLSRAVAAGLLILTAFGAALTILILLVPPLVEQTVALAGQLPRLMVALQQQLRPLAARVLAGLQIAPPSDLTQPLIAAAQEVLGSTTKVLASVMTRGLALVNLLSLLAITPLVAFYLLRDWPRIVADVDDWLPRAHADTIRTQMRAIDHVLAGFARGAAIVCVALGVFYAVALSLVGLDFALVIG